MEDRLTDLEIKFSYQEQLIEELNQQVVEQQKEVNQLKALLKKLEEQIRSVGEGLIDSDQEVPPPHY